MLRISRPGKTQRIHRVRNSGIADCGTSGLGSDCPSKWSEPPLAESPDQQGVAVRSVKTQHVQGNLAFCGMNLLANAKYWRAMRNAQKPSAMSVGGCSIDFFVRVGYFEAIIALQDGKKRDPVQPGSSEAAELVRAQVAGFDGKRFLPAEPQSFELDQAAADGQRKTRGNFLLRIDHIQREQF